MGQVLVMAHSGGSAGTAARMVEARSSETRGTVVQVAFGGAVPSRADRRRAAAHDRAAAQARRVASAAVDGSLADLALTRRGRWVLWSMAIATATGMAVMGGGALASTPELPQEVVLHTVSEGDNLWSLAEGIARPGEDLRDVVELIIGVNGRASATLWAGEQIMIPVRN